MSQGQVAGKQASKQVLIQLMMPCDAMRGSLVWIGGNGVCRDVGVPVWMDGLDSWELFRLARS